MKIERLMNIILYLNNHQRVTADALAQRYGVSVKTIRRDVDAISAAGIPIVAHQGREGGYEILRNFKINSSVLTRNESDLLLKLLGGLEKTCPFKEIVNLQAKLAVVPKCERQDESMIFIDFSAWGMSEKMLVKMKLVEEAFHESRLISFSYRNLQGECSTRQVEPLKLIFKGSSWYLLAWCLQKQAYRFFKIRRMVDLFIGDLCREKHDANFVDLHDSWQCKTEEIKLAVSEDFYQKLDDYFDDYTIEGHVATVHWPVDEWLYSYILSMGAGVSVIAPEHLRLVIKAKIAAMVVRYQ